MIITKKRIISFLIRLINKIDPDHIETEQLTYGDEIIFKYRKYLPNDNKWHKIGMTFECWALANQAKDKTEKMYVDGVLVSELPKVDNFDNDFNEG